MVTNENRLTAYFGFFAYFYKSCNFSNRILLKIFKLHYVRTCKELETKHN